MYDKKLALEILHQIDWSVQTIQKRVKPIKSADDFTISDTGLEKLDAICMQLIAIGESLKNLDKVTGLALLKNYPEVEWDKVKGMRDVISHHYFDVNAEVVYTVCVDHLAGLGKTIQKIIKDIK